MDAITSIVRRNLCFSSKNQGDALHPFAFTESGNTPSGTSEALHAGDKNTLSSKGDARKPGRPILSAPYTYQCVRLWGIRAIRSIHTMLHLRSSFPVLPLALAVCEKAHTRDVNRSS